MKTWLIPVICLISAAVSGGETEVNRRSFIAYSSSPCSGFPW